MKILLVNKFLFAKGGDAICTLDTGSLLASKGHRVIYWGMDHPLNPDYLTKDYFVRHIDFESYASIRQRIKMTLNILYSFEAKHKFEALIKKEKPDVVHLNNFAHQISPSILHILKKYNIPAVMTMHDYKLVCPSYRMLSNGDPCEKCGNGEYYKCLLNKCTKNSYSKSLVNTLEMYLHHRVLNVYDLIDDFISPSIFLKDKLEEMGFNKKILYLPNFINLDDFEPGYSWQENSIAFFGRLSGEKGLVTLITAVKNIQSITLKIIGDGPIKQDLQDWVVKNNIRNILFLGPRFKDELKNELTKAMFVVIPSEWYENNPRTVLEAFALGKPVIGADIGGIPELVKNGRTGLLFKPGNADNLRERIEMLIGDSDKVIVIGKNARSFVEEEFNAEKHYRALMEIYENSLA